MTGAFIRRLCLAITLGGLGGVPCVAQSAAVEVESLQQLLQQVKQQREQERQALRQREQSFLKAQKEQQRLLEQARALKLKHEKSLRPLQQALDEGAVDIAALQQELQEKSRNLRDLQGAFMRVAGEVSATLKQSVVSMERPQRNQELARLAAMQTLPAIDDLESLWLLMQDEMTAAAEVSRYEGGYVAANGVLEQAQITRVGLFTVFSDNGFLRYIPETAELLLPVRQPPARYLSAMQNGEDAKTGMTTLAVDPSRGTLINQLSYSPSIQERIEQAGLIGTIILALGAGGALLALWQGLWLSWVSFKVSAQLRQLGSPTENNPLGRVLLKASRFSTENDENYQFKLDEAVLTELPALERGQNFIKLLAAVAPLLGLLGTVTGMILTFQSISLFGNGDPKLMAGGISQALMTTVLGLVVAIPLLFSHSFVVSLSRNLIQRLDEQSAGLLARRLEQGRAQSAAGTRDD